MRPPISHAKITPPYLGSLPPSFAGRLVGRMLKSVLAFVAATMIFAVILALVLFYLVKVLAS
jgi:hypothetical protein